MSKTRIGVGIYGNKGAGKTTFLKRCLDGLMQSGEYSRVRFYRRDVEEKAWLFCSDTNSLLNLKDGVVVATDARTDYKVDFELNGLEYELIFTDLMGEVLRIGMNDVNSNSTRSANIVKEQIHKCNVYLFVVDPTGYGSENRDVKNFDENEFLKNYVVKKEHLEEERILAAQFIDAVIAMRGNRNLPVLFVLTHKDIVDKLSAENRREIDTWLNDAISHLQAKYNEELYEGLYPDLLVVPHKVGHKISSIEKRFADTKIDPLLKSIFELVAACRKPRMQDRGLSLILTVLVALFVLFGIPGGYYLYTRQNLPQDSINSPESITSKKNANDRESANLIAQLDKIPSQWPADTALKRTMTVVLGRIKQTVQNPGSDPLVADNLRKAFHRAGKRIEAEILDDSIAGNAKKKLQIAELLTDLWPDDIEKYAPDSFDVNKLAHKIEEMFRTQLCEKMRDAVIEHVKSETAPVELYKLLNVILKREKERIEKTNILHTEVDRPLLVDIKDAIPFLLKLIEKKNYKVQIRIDGSAPALTTLFFKFQNQSGKEQSINNGAKTVPNSSGPFDFTLDSNPYSFTLPISRQAPRLKLFKEEWGQNTPTEIDSISFDVEKASNLGALGMPLIFKNEKTFPVTVAGKNSDITLNFSFTPDERYQIPKLLWTALPEKEFK